MRIIDIHLYQGVFYQCQGHERWKNQEIPLMDELETRRYGYRKSTNQKINTEKKMDESRKKG